MGLIKTAIKCGAMYGIAHEGIKALDKHNQPQQTQPINQPVSRDASGYIHQHYCNGTCGGHCNGVQLPQSRKVQQQSSFNNAGYVHLPYCEGNCGLRCNDGQTRVVEQPWERKDEKLPAYPSK